MGSNGKTLILGNSFLAAIKAAMPDELPDIVIAAGSGRVLLDLVPGEVAASVTIGGPSAQSSSQWDFWELTSGIRGPIPLASFDTVVVIGLFPPYNAWIFDNCQLVEGDLPEVMSSKMPISFAAYRLCSRYRVSVARARDCVELLKGSDGGRRVLLFPQPHIMDGAETYGSAYDVPEKWRALSDAERQVIWKNEETLYKRLLEEQGCEIILPPEEVVVDGNRCPAAFSENPLGSKNFDPTSTFAWTPHDMQMYLTHKNKDYGAIVWRHIERAIASAT